MRVLGDRMSRRTAWDIARERDWATLHLAEYLAVARLQADALVSVDPESCSRRPTAWYRWPRWRHCPCRDPVGSGEVEPVEVHDLGPRGHEVARRTSRSASSLA